MADATTVLNEISAKLTTLGDQALRLWSDDKSIAETQNWTYPAITRFDLADYLRSPIDLIERVDPASFTNDELARLEQFPARLQMVQNHLANFMNGNGVHIWTQLSGAVIALNAILERRAFKRIDLRAVADKKVLPEAQLRQLRSLEQSIGRLQKSRSELASKMDDIERVHAAAEGLPDELDALSDARAELDQTRRDYAQQIAAHAKTSTEVDALQTRLAAAADQAAAIIARANSAYSASTTQGLGKAFHERQKELAQSTIVLGLVLVAALAVGGWITFQRVSFVQQLMLRPNIGFNVLWMNVTLTALSVSAPVWLAWLLTRQIGQRFRLAEDYGYKAALAKAYEGYREEAANVDPELSKKLFGISLDMLNEAPLRLVEKESPGSPMHEAQSPVAKVIEHIKPRRRRAAGLTENAATLDE